MGLRRLEARTLVFEIVHLGKIFEHLGVLLLPIALILLRSVESNEWLEVDALN